MANNRRVIRYSSIACVFSVWMGAATIASGANLFANVAADGTLISGNGVSSVTVLGPGQYEVTFTSNVSTCAYVATTANAHTQAIQAYTAGGHLGANGVFVEIKNQGGGLMEGAFSLIAVCDAPKVKFAVVGYGSDLVRATPGTTLTDLGAGRYEVQFLASVKACAYVATVGDPGSDLVFNPSGVYTGSGPNSQTVYIETKNPGGGLQGGIPFHLAVICANTPKARVAVVNNSGLAQRGSALTSAFNSAIGEYTVVTNMNIDPACATVATRGSADKSVPFTPATVELVPGPAANTIGIQVRELLFFGGDLINQAFHAATLCK